MRPRIGDTVIYTRAVGEELAAVITRVTRRETKDLEIVAQQRGQTIPVLEVLMREDETEYDVWLAIHVHTPQRGDTVYTPGPVKFCATAPSRNNSWRWRGPTAI